MEELLQEIMLQSNFIRAIDDGILFIESKFFIDYIYRLSNDVKIQGNHLVCCAVRADTKQGRKTFLR